MEKIIKLQEWLSINTTMTVIMFDYVTILYRKYEKDEIGDQEYTLRMIDKMKTPDSDWKIIEDILNGDFNVETQDKLSKWWDILKEVMKDFLEAKKKQTVWSEDTKGL